MMSGREGYLQSTGNLFPRTKQTHKVSLFNQHSVTFNKLGYQNNQKFRLIFFLVPDTSQFLPAIAALHKDSFLRRLLFLTAVKSGNVTHNRIVTKKKHKAGRYILKSLSKVFSQKKIYL